VQDSGHFYPFLGELSPLNRPSKLRPNTFLCGFIVLRLVYFATPFCPGLASRRCCWSPPFPRATPYLTGVGVALTKLPFVHVAYIYFGCNSAIKLRLKLDFVSCVPPRLFHPSCGGVAHRFFVTPTESSPVDPHLPIYPFGNIVPLLEKRWIYRLAPQGERYEAESKSCKRRGDEAVHCFLAGEYESMVILSDAALPPNRRGPFVVHLRSVFLSRLHFLPHRPNNDERPSRVSPSPSSVLSQIDVHPTCQSVASLTPCVPAQMPRIPRCSGSSLPVLPLLMA